jgi:hypothetical protein
LACAGARPAGACPDATSPTGDAEAGPSADAVADGASDATVQDAGDDVDATSLGSPDADAASMGSADADAASMGSADADAASMGSADADAASMGSADADAASMGNADADAASVGSADADAASVGSADADGASLVTDAASDSGNPSDAPSVDGVAVDAEPVDANPTNDAGVDGASDAPAEAAAYDGGSGWESVDGGPPATTYGDGGLPAVSCLSLSTNDLAVAPTRAVLFASVGSTSALCSNSVVRIDPATVAASATVFAGTEPAALAISDDGSSLYVGLNGTDSVKCVDPATGIHDPPVNLGSTQFSGPGAAATRKVVGTPM